MPNEMRRIVFTEGELTVALSEHDSVSGQQIPPGGIQSCEPAGENGTAVRVELVGNGESAGNNLEIDPEEVQAALVRFCVRRKVPLPKNSKKTVGQMNGKICLDIQVPRRSYAEKAKDRPEWWEAIKEQG